MLMAVSRRFPGFSYNDSKWPIAAIGEGLLP
jgi:hypothetical protein